MDYKLYQAHRLAWLYVYGRFPNGQLDHKNGNKLDNRIINLRKATDTQNHANSKARRSRSNLKGAHWFKRDGKWQAKMTGRNNKTIYLGTFDTAKAAHAAYCRAARKLYGVFFNKGY